MIHSRGLRWWNIVKVLSGDVHTRASRVTCTVRSRVFATTTFIWSTAGGHCHGGFVGQMRNVWRDARPIWRWLRNIIYVITTRGIVWQASAVFLSRGWCIIHSKAWHVDFGTVFHGGRSIVVHLTFRYCTIDGVTSVMSHWGHIIVMLWRRVKLKNISLSDRSHNLQNIEKSHYFQAFIYHYCILYHSCPSL